MRQRTTREGVPKVLPRTEVGDEPRHKKAAGPRGEIRAGPLVCADRGAPHSADVRHSHAVIGKVALQLFRRLQRLRISTLLVPEFGVPQLFQA